MVSIAPLVLMPRDYALLSADEDPKARQDHLEAALTPIMARYDPDVPRPHREPVDPKTVEDTRSYWEEVRDDGLLKYGKSNPGWHRNLVADGAFMGFLEPRAETAPDGAKGVSHVQLDNPEGYFVSWKLGGLSRGRWIVKRGAPSSAYLLSGGDPKPSTADAAVLGLIDWDATRMTKVMSGISTSTIIDARDPDDIQLLTGWDFEHGRWPSDEARAAWKERWEKIMEEVRKTDPQIVVAQLDARTA